MIYLVFKHFYYSTYSNNNKLKISDFIFNWKNHFVNESKLLKKPTQYSYSNLILEKNSVQWEYKAVWYGRFEKFYKIHPESLNETQEINIPELSL